ncbi:MAG: methyltransferase domain-containing protein [Aggregatilineales bacterium]
MPNTFDALAPTYDDDFTNTQIGQYLRGRVHDRLLTHFNAGDHVLELGCGTGEDARYLAENGIHVTATDASEKMLVMARAKNQMLEMIDFKQMDLRQLNPNYDGAQFSGGFSNFGVLNCLDDWRPLATWLAQRIAPAGVVGFGIMSPFCIWEMLWHGAHLNFNTATRRLRTHTVFSPDSMLESLNITYPTIRRLSQDFSPFFQHITVRPLGVFLPPSDVYGVIEKRPALLKRLMQLEHAARNTGKLALLADHYWIEFRRIAT